MVVGGWPWQMCGWWGRAERLGKKNADGRITQVITPNGSVGRRDNLRVTFRIEWTEF